MAFALADGQRMQRKKMITVVEWNEGTGDPKREVLGKRTPDSSIEWNVDKQKSTDILGHTYTDVEKVEPTQTFDPHYIIGGSAFDEYLVKSILSRDTDKFNGVFTIYVIFAAIDSGTEGAHAYYATKEVGCTISPNSLGGEAYVGMPIELDFSNNITEGTVDKLGDDFEFTAA